MLLKIKIHLFPLFFFFFSSAHPYRTCKRYFYTNNTTGHSQWEYPDQPPKEEGNELPDNIGSVAVSLPLSLLPPPPPPPSLSQLSLEKDALEEVDKEHQKVAKECERRERSSSEKEKYSSSKSEGRKEKRSRKVRCNYFYQTLAKCYEKEKPQKPIFLILLSPTSKKSIYMGNNIPISSSLV